MRAGQLVPILVSAQPPGGPSRTMIRPGARDRRAKDDHAIAMHPSPSPAAARVTTLLGHLQPDLWQRSGNVVGALPGACHRRCVVSAVNIVWSSICGSLSASPASMSRALTASMARRWRSTLRSDMDAHLARSRFVEAIDQGWHTRVLEGPASPGRIDQLLSIGRSCGFGADADARGRRASVGIPCGWRRYSASVSPEPPDSAGKSLNLGRPSFMGSTVDS
jgi:hypothetical protein